jgi:hypothetical protein
VHRGSMALSAATARPANALKPLKDNADASGGNRSLMQEQKDRDEQHMSLGEQRRVAFERGRGRAPARGSAGDLQARGQGLRGRASARDGATELRAETARASSGKGKRGQAPARGGRGRAPAGGSVSKLRQREARASSCPRRPRVSSGQVQRSKLRQREARASSCPRRPRASSGQVQREQASAKGGVGELLLKTAWASSGKGRRGRATNRYLLF